MKKKFVGVFTVVCTAFDEKGNIDERALRRLIRWQLDECKVHGIIPCGSTGEFAFLTPEERKQVVAITIDEVKGKVPVFAGSAACATREVVETGNIYKEMGVDGIMVVPSYYGHLNQDELYGHFAEIAKNIDLPIIVYNNPGTSHSDILPETVAELANKFNNIVAIKESTGIMQRLFDITLLAGDNIEVLCGCDTLSLEMFRMGVEGWIAAPANVFAKQCVKLHNLAVEQKDFDAAWEFYKKTRPIFDLFENSGMYVALSKAGLEILGLGVGQPRKPVFPATDEMKGKVKSLIDSFK